MTTAKTCMADLAAVFSRLPFVESCGQCPPCKLGTGASLESIRAVALRRRRRQSVLSARRRAATDRKHPAHVPEDFETHLQGECTHQHRAIVPKLVDIVNGVPAFDERQMHKRPDWTYEP